MSINSIFSGFFQDNTTSLETSKNEQKKTTHVDPSDIQKAKVAMQKGEFRTVMEILGPYKDLSQSPVAQRLNKKALHYFLLISKAHRNLSDGYYSSSIRNCEELLSQFPKQEEALIIRETASLYGGIFKNIEKAFKNKKYDQVISECHNILNVYPANRMVHVRLLIAESLQSHETHKREN